MDSMIALRLLENLRLAASAAAAVMIITDLDPGLYSRLPRYDIFGWQGPSGVHAEAFG